MNDITKIAKQIEWLMDKIKYLEENNIYHNDIKNICDEEIKEKLVSCLKQVLSEKKVSLIETLSQNEGQ